MSALLRAVRTLRTTALVAATLLASCIAPVTAETIDGSFALQRGMPRAAGQLDVTTPGADPLVKRLVFSMRTAGSTQLLRRYDVDMTKLMHVIIVSADFSVFMHVHPVVASDGRFMIDQRFPRAGLYYVYADADPHCLGQQVFRFAVPVGNAADAARHLRPTGPTAVAGPYMVTLSGTNLRAGSESKLAVRITRGGRLARDMETYLGAAAHAVFLDAKDLTYVHVHPLPADVLDDDMPMAMTMPGDDTCISGMAMPPTHASPTMLLHVGVDEPGTYELWLQFRAGGRFYVAPFVVTAHAA